LAEARWESLQRSPDLLSEFRGLTSKEGGGEGTRREERKSRAGREKVGERREGGVPQVFNPTLTTDEVACSK